MVRQPRYLLNREGRYFARLVIPAALRPYLENKTELREALGADRRIALSRLHGAVATLQHKIRQAEILYEQRKESPAEPGRYLLTADQLAVRNYHERLQLDEKARSSGSAWSNIGINDVYVADLRAGAAGKLSDAALFELVGPSIERYRQLGNTTAAFGTDEWRTIGRMLCVSELEVLTRMVKRDDGDFSGIPEHPVIKQGEPIVDEHPPVPLRDLFNRYMTELRANGKGEGAEKRWRPIIEDLIKFAKTTDARKLTKRQIVEWKDAKIASLSPRTVRDVYLTAINAVLNWAVSNDLLETNPARDVRLKVAPKGGVAP